MNYLDSIRGISEEQDNDLHIVMGKPGSGKTTYVGTYPKPMLVITVGDDGGAVVLKHYGDEQVKFINITSDDPKEDGIHVGEKLKGIINELLNTNHGFKTIAIDAYSSVQEEIVEYLGAIKGKRLNQEEWGDIGKYLLGIRDDLVTLSRKPNISAVVPIVHIKTTEDTDNASGETNLQVIPKLTVNNGRLLLERANTVVYCSRRVVLSEDEKDKKVQFLTYIGAHPNIDTKLRTDGKVLDSGLYIENATYEKLENIRATGKVDGENKLKVKETSISKDEEDDRNW